ncbi:MAG: hypothetical protein ACYTFQ_18985 [Planctomycetota bacterium]|jgi:hypothetical protein
MKTQKTTRKMKSAVSSGLPALTLACVISIRMPQVRYKYQLLGGGTFMPY